MDQPEDAGLQRRVRQRRSVAEKRRIVELTLVAGASLALVARAHGVNANQVFKWRREYERGELAAPPASSSLLPVVLTGADRPQATPASIHIELPGRALMHRERGRSDPVTFHFRKFAQVIGPPTGTNIWIAAGVTDMRRAAGAVAYVVAHQVGDDGGVPRIVFRDAGFHLAHQVSAHVSSLGINAAAKLGKERDQRGAKTKTNQLVRDMLRILQSAEEVEQAARIGEKRTADPCASSSWPPGQSTLNALPLRVVPRMENDLQGKPYTCLCRYVYGYLGRSTRIDSKPLYREASLTSSEDR